ncbi:MAG: glycoside hydrolase family 3 N-terminal domain-containing protein [Lachnospiraceae bacterium]
MWRKEERIDRSKMGKRRWNQKRIYKNRRRIKFRFWIILFLCIGLAAGLGVGGLVVYTTMSKPKNIEKNKQEIRFKQSKKRDVQKSETKKTTKDTDTKKEPSKDASKSKEDPAESKAKELMARMTLEEKVAQMFFIKPEALTDVEVVVQAGDTTKEMLTKYPVGGFYYSTQNVEDETQLKTMLTNTKAYNKYPMFLGIEEEGGKQASSLANSGLVQVPQVADMKDIGKTGDASKAKEAGTVLGGYLSTYGFNVDFAPLADVCTNPQNTQISTRAFGATSESVSAMVPEIIKGMQSKGIRSVGKYFPGNGDSIEDAETLAATSSKSMEQLQKIDLVPFQAAIKANVDFIMVGHVSFPSIVGDGTPASLSPKIVKDLLRTKLKYNGIIITNSLDAGVITQTGDSASVAVKAIQAGCDMMLQPEDFETAYNGVISAVRSKTITEERINESVIRILKAKLKV